MKIRWLFALLCPGTAFLLRADPVIGFDDLPSDQVPVRAGYHELNWNNLDYLNGASYSGNPSGYQAGVVSGSDVIYNAAAGTGVISAGLFDFDSAYATAAWNDNLSLVAKGYINGTLVYDQTNRLSATSPTLVNFNFYGVDKVELSSFGGTPHAGYTASGTEFVMDNVDVVTYVPYSPALVTNGGFETGDFSGWSIFGNTNFTDVTNNAAYVHSGSYGDQVGPTLPGYLSQIVGPTQIGESYSVSCWLYNSGGGANNFTMSWGDYPVFGLTNQPAFGWTNVQINLLATRPTEFLEFEFQNSAYYFGFDDVSVTPAVLVSNGGFETGDFSGWSSSSAKDLVDNLPTARRAGSFGADFGSSGTLGYISQPIATLPGQPYLVSLWLDSPDGLTPNRFQFDWGGQTVMNESGLGAFGWTNLHFTVMGASTQTTLQFGLRDDNSFLGLDEVSVVPVPVLQNGGFEFGDFTGWTTNGNVSHCLVSPDYAQTGFYGGAFGPELTLGYLSQTFATIPGQTYLIGFMLDNPSAMVNTEFNVAWNGNTLIDFTNLALTGWLPYEFLVTAAGANSTLKFGFRDDPSFLGLDGVFVAPITPPEFESITKTNESTHLSWNVLPGYLYSLEYSTNLVNTNWTVLQTASFPPTIPMTATDTNPPDAGRFYRVVMYPPPLIF